jgi:hypothetical protein
VLLTVCLMSLWPRYVRIERVSRPALAQRIAGGVAQHVGVDRGRAAWRVPFAFCGLRMMERGRLRDDAQGRTITSQTLVSG